MNKQAIKDHKDLEVYKMAFDVAMQIFELSKKFPVEEKYSLTDQIRRPRAFCMCKYGRSMEKTSIPSSICS